VRFGDKGAITSQAFVPHFSRDPRALKSPQRNYYGFAPSCIPMESPKKFSVKAPRNSGQCWDPLDQSGLAALYYSQGQYAEAEPLYQRALGIRGKALGPEHLDVATSLENYASLLRNTHRPEDAISLESRAKAIRAKHA
jgi:tetratricopeptide (TPR) repeat protein